MKSGTRRMWSRRLLRAGWLIAPIFQLPKYLAKKTVDFRYWLQENKGLVIFILFIATLIGGFIYLVVNDSRKYDNASPEDIKEAMADNVCVKNNMADRLEYYSKLNRAMTRRDITELENECQALIDLDAQKEVLKEIK